MLTAVSRGLSAVLSQSGQANECSLWQRSSWEPGKHGNIYSKLPTRGVIREAYKQA